MCLFPNSASKTESMCLFPNSNQKPKVVSDGGRVPASGPSEDYKRSSPSFPTRASIVAQLVKNLPAIQETWVPSLGWEDPLEKGMATFSSRMAWRIHGQKGLAGYSTQHCKELKTTQWLTRHSSQPPQMHNKQVTSCLLVERPSWAFQGGSTPT